MMNVKEYLDEARKNGEYKTMIIAAHGNSLQIGAFGDMRSTPIMLADIFYTLEKRTGVNVKDISDLMVLGYKMRVCAERNDTDTIDELIDEYSKKSIELFGDGKYE